MIDIAKTIFSMLELRDEEPCVCLSGKLFKDCHKIVFQSERENPKKLFAELLRIKKKKECLFGNGNDCSGRIVKAHSISRKHLRHIVDSDNHVYSFIKTARSMENVSFLFEGGGLPGPEKIGINDVTTFSGLCEKHDVELFSSFEKRAFACDADQVAALHLRSVLKEIHVKTEAILTTAEAQKAIGKVAKGSAAAQKNALNMIMAMGNNLSLRDLYVELGLTRDCISGRPSEKLLNLCFEVEGDCPALCSSTVNPAYDLNAVLIQNYNDEKIFTRSFSYTVIAESDRYFFLLSWFQCDEIRAFLESLFERMRKNELQWLIQMVFAFSENAAINIKWFDSLSIIKKERLKKIFYSDVQHMDSGRSTVGEFRNSNYVSGRIVKMTSNDDTLLELMQGR